MKNSWYGVIALVACLASCSEYKKGNGGLLYKIVDNKSETKIGDTAFVSVSYTEALESGKVLYQTGTLDARPAMVFARIPEFKGDFQDALQYLGEGDSAIIKVSMDSLKHKGYQFPKDTSKFMMYHVRINKVINKNGAADTTYPARIEKYKNEQMLMHRATENVKIQNCLAHSRLKFKSTISGLLYPDDLRIVNNSGKKITFNYVFSSLDGKIFDTNKRELAIKSGVYNPTQVYEPHTLRPEDARFAGFREALSIIPQGSKTTVIIPSVLAYGANGSNANIPPYTPLRCEFEVKLTNP